MDKLVHRRGTSAQGIGLDAPFSAQEDGLHRRKQSRNWLSRLKGFFGPATAVQEADTGAQKGRQFHIETMKARVDPRVN